METASHRAVCPHVGWSAARGMVRRSRPNLRGSTESRPIFSLGLRTTTGYSPLITDFCLTQVCSVSSLRMARVGTPKKDQCFQALSHVSRLSRVFGKGGGGLQCRPQSAKLQNDRETVSAFGPQELQTPNQRPCLAPLKSSLRPALHLKSSFSPILARVLAALQLIHPLGRAYSSPPSYS